MALIELKSDLSWYKKKPGFSPNADRKSTDFKYNDDLTTSTSVTGFSNIGNMVGFRRVTTEDGFPFNGGDAKRLAQLGGGTKFPIGPTGNSYEFDKVRFGFSPKARYGDIYGGQPASGDNAHFGLSKTYTEDSPINDMYNKFNLRDDATPNPGYAKQPFILRGIQREGSSDPQRWGLGETLGGKISSTFDLPRAGILTAVERSAIDALRIGKFLISPRGIGFLARQFGYQLMNPNLENASGIATGLPATQLYNPLSSPISAIGNFIGIHPYRHGIPFMTGGPLGGGSEYEGIKRIQGEKFNRLNNLKKEAYGKIGEFTQGLPFLTMTGPKGPGSVLGIGVTTHRKHTNTTIMGQSIYGSLPAMEAIYLSNRQNKYGSGETLGADPTTYQSFRGNTGQGWDVFQIDDGENLRLTNIGIPSLHYSLKQQIETPLKALWKEAELLNNGKRDGEEGGGKAQSTDPDYQPINSGDIKYYKTLEYGDLKRDASAGIKKSFETNTTYENDNTIQTKYGYPDYKLGERADAKDAIQGLEYGEDYDDVKDLIKFKFQPLRLTDTSDTNDNPIIFRAFINTLNDSFQPSWDSQTDQGRADAKVMYSGFARSISIDFSVPLFSKAELKPVWNKLDELARLTYPIYVSSGFTGTYVKVTIGDLYTGVPMYISDLTYDWDNETPWELDDGTQVPYYTNVSMTLNWIGTQRPEYNTKAFSLNGVT